MRRNSARSGSVSSTAALFHTAPSPRVVAASTTAYPVHDAEDTCSHTGTFDSGSGEAISTTLHGAAKALALILATIESGRSSPRMRWSPSTSASPSRSRPAPLTTAKRQGRSPP